MKTLSDIEDPASAGAEATPRLRTGQLRRVLTSRQTRWGLVLLAAVVLFALIGPLVAPHSPSAIVGKPFQGPGAGHLVGTDELGRDVWSRVLNGGYNLVWMATAAAALGVLLGAFAGMAGAYFRGVIDGALMRLVDGLLAFPPIVFALLFISMFGPSRPLLVVLVAVGHVPGVTRVIRGATQPILQQEYVLWSRAVGLPARQIIARQVLPNVTSPLMVEFGLRIMWSVGTMAALSFIGYGIQPPAADWGLMVSENRSALVVQPIVVLVPIACIALFTIGANLSSEGLARIIGRTEGRRGL